MDTDLGGLFWWVVGKFGYGGLGMVDGQAFGCLRVFKFT